MIVFLGLAGSGKSTQSQLLAQKLGCPWISTGQLLRDNIKDEAIRGRMLAGEMLDDSLLLSLLEGQLMKLRQSEFILDGSPRTMNQARWLFEKVIKHKIKLTAVIHLKASKEVVRQRLLGRGRPDDTPEAIAERFREYDKTIVPILDFFRDNGVKVYEIDGEVSPKAVENQILKTAGISNEI